MQPGMSLSTALLERQKIGPDGREALLAKHAEVDAVIERLDALPEGHGQAPALVGEIQKLEFELQDLWGFPRIADMHTHWHRPRACRCDKAVNRLMWTHGVRARAVHASCPLHGGDGYAPAGATVVRQVLLGEDRRH